MARQLPKSMIRMAIQKRSSTWIKCLLIILPHLCGCKNKDRTSQKISELTQDSLLLISEQWKADSSGCARQRDVNKITRLIDQTKLIGKDTAVLITYLGNPNHKEYHEGKTIYYYYLECGEDGKVSYDNFYCYFRGDSLFSYQHKTF